MKTLYKLIIILFFTVTNHAISQTTYTSVATGAWSSASTWSPSGVPQSDSPVIIGNHTVTVTADATCASVTMSGTSTSSILTINNTKKLTVSGNFVVIPSNAVNYNPTIKGQGKLQVVNLQVGLATLNNTFPTTNKTTTLTIETITELKITGDVISTTPVNTAPAAYNYSKINHKSGTIDLDGKLLVTVGGAGPTALGYINSNANAALCKIIFRNENPFTLTGQVIPDFSRGTVEYLSTATTDYELPEIQFKNLILNSTRTFNCVSNSTRILPLGKLYLTNGILKSFDSNASLAIYDGVEIIKTGGSIFNNDNSRLRLVSEIDTYSVTYNQHTSSIDTGRELLGFYNGLEKVNALNTITINTTNGVVVNPITSIANETAAQTASLLIKSNCALSGSGKIKVTNLLDLPSGSTVSTTDGLINLVSNASNTARVATLSSTASITGKVVVERYLKNIYRRWRLLTAPVKGGSNNSVYDNWQNSGNVNNLTGADFWGPDGNWEEGTPGNGLVLINNSSYNLRKFNNTTGSWSNVTNTITEPLFESSINKGFLSFITHPFNNGTNGQGAYNSTPTSTTLYAKGELITGDVTYNNILNNKFYMIGNPYASPINFKTILQDSSNSGVDTIWFMDTDVGDLGGYNTYFYDVSAQEGIYGNDIGTHLYLNTVFQSGQAFFVRAKVDIPNTSMTIKEIHKSNLTSLTLNKTTSTLTNTAFELFRIQFEKEVNNQFLNMDGCVAVFKAGGSNDLTKEDVSKISNPNNNLALFNTNSSLSIESRNLIQDNDFLTLKVTQATAGITYKLKLYTQNFTYTGTAYLQDLFLGTNTALPLDGSVFEYNFQITTDALSYGNRFKIVFQSAVLSATEIATNSFAVYPNPANPHESVTIVFPTSTDTDAYEYKIYNNLGQLVQFDKLSKQNSTGTIPLSSKLISGLYFVQLHNTNNNAIATKTLLLK
jgi:hypothetical protein